jgi:hypothetical protein
MELTPRKIIQEAQDRGGTFTFKFVRTKKAYRFGYISSLHGEIAGKSKVVVSAGFATFRNYPRKHLKIHREGSSSLKVPWSQADVAGLRTVFKIPTSLED